jgi:3-phenylpropionate/trans-cinnamate dioxygenase ferredoxin subunit
VSRVKLARVDEIPEGGLVMREHGGRQVLLAKIEGKIHAMDDVCSHAGGPLHQGTLGQEGKFLVTCPWHDAHFDLRTGKVHQDTDWAENQETYAVTVDGDDVYVEL